MLRVRLTRAWFPFSWSRPQTKRAEGLIGIHVDDLLCCSAPFFKEQLKLLEKRFLFGSRKEHEFIYTGLKSKQHLGFSMQIDQEVYVKDSRAIPFTRARRQDDFVTDSERQ